MSTFLLPDLGEGLTDAVIHQWHVQPGSTIQEGEPLLSVETAKALVEIPTPQSGTIQMLHAQIQQNVEVGAPLVTFATEKNKASAVSSHPQSTTVVGRLPDEIKLWPVDAHTSSLSSAQSISSIPKPPRVLPAVRALARQLNINLESIQLDHAQDHITLEDVRHALEQRHLEHHKSSYTTTDQHNPPPPLSTTIDAVPEHRLHGLRRQMSSLMNQSHHEVVPATLLDDADLYRWHTSADITVRLIQAIVHACQEYPALNAHFNPAQMTYEPKEAIHLGLAVNTQQGLLAPVIHNAHQASAETLRTAINHMKHQAQTQKFSPKDLQGATFILSNFGSVAGRYGTPVLPPPAVAIIAVGRRYDAVVAHQGCPAVHPVLPISLTINHRVITGAEAALFLKAFIDHLEHPSC